MRSWLKSSSNGISMVSVERWPVYTRSAGILQRRWRRLMLRDSGCWSLTNEWMMRWPSPYLVVSPDTALQATLSGRSIARCTSRSSTSSVITRVRRLHSSRTWYRLKVLRIQRVLQKRNQIQIGDDTSTMFTQSPAAPRSSSGLQGSEHSGRPFWKLTEWWGASGSTTTAVSSTGFGG